MTCKPEKKYTTFLIINNMERIEFYKNRSLSERFSASVDFLKQNWKVLYKNILIGAIPLAIVGGYFAQYYLQASFTNIYSGQALANPFYILLYVIAIVALGIYLNSMPGAILKKYGEGELTPSTGWNELSGSMFSLSGKTFAISFMVGIVIVVLAATFGVVFSFLADGGLTGVFFVFGIVLFIMLAILLAFSPSLSLIFFPAYFSGAGNRESIKIAFGMGFRNWGSAFVTLLLAGIVLYVIVVIFAIPSIIITFISPGEITFLTFLFTFITILGEILAYPIFFIFIAFQYFSIVEKEQGVSLQSKVSEFENL